MSKTLLVNGCELTVKEEEVEKIIEMFKDSVQIDDLTGWQMRDTNEVYNVNKFFQKAQEYSEKMPPDTVQFCEKLWGGVALCVKEYILKKCGVLIKSHAARSAMLNAICAGLTGKQSKEVADTYSKAERCHCNFYEQTPMTKTEREELLVSAKRMCSTIETADVEIVKSEIRSQGGVTFRNVSKKCCKIGAFGYDYNTTVF